MNNKYEVVLGDLNMQQCEVVRQWRNKLEGVLRTPFFLTDKMQESFYNNIICNRNSNNRFFGVYTFESLDSSLAINTKTMQARRVNEFIGMVGLVNIEWENGLAEVSMIINPNLCNKGIGSQALDLLLDKGFNHMNLINIYGEVYECNSAVNFWVKQIKKYDAYTTTLPSRKYFDGKYFNSVYFNFNFNDWRLNK
jgi:hypothetical protein